jgi:hypothetical protein
VTRKSKSVPAPKNAPADAAEVYDRLSDLNDRFLAVTDDDIADGVGEDLIAELAEIRDVMVPLHKQYKSDGYMTGAVSKWRNLNSAIPKRCKQ